MNNSILNDVKKLLNAGGADYTPFDRDIIIHVNSVFGILKQLGVIRPEGFSITGYDETWSDVIEEANKLEMVKSYVALKVRLAFDPPASSFVLDAIKSLIDEYEWRLNVEVETSDDSWED